MNKKKGHVPAFKGKKGELNQMSAGIKKSIVAENHDGDRYNSHMEKGKKLPGA